MIQGQILIGIWAPPPVGGRAVSITPQPFGLCGVLASIPGAMVQQSPAIPGSQLWQFAVSKYL
jgi:hypothetical protein